MRLSIVTSAALLAFGVWGTSAAPAGLEFSETPQAAATPSGDAVRGAEAYEASCGGCHSIDANRIGPAHRDVVGRKAGTAPDFDYSDAMKSSGVVWTPETLDQWLANPQGFIKGARMGFRLADAQRRADVIAYLSEQK
jgi:cytochrome c